MTEPKIVDLPHDYIIDMPRNANAPGQGSNGYYGDGRGDYTKVFTLPEDWKNLRVKLYIDGSYMNTEVYLNGNPLIVHPYGYTPFVIELTSYLKAGENELKIITQSRQPSSRWYSGGGLYRTVELWGGNGLTPWDVLLETVEKGENAQVICHGAENLLCRVVNMEGDIVAEGTGSAVVSDPKLWDIDTPYLYTVQMIDGDDVLVLPLGIRYIQCVPGKGMLLNGHVIKLHGGCIHHDNGCLGAEAWPDAEERKILFLRLR